MRRLLPTSLLLPVLAFAALLSACGSGDTRTTTTTARIACRRVRQPEPRPDLRRRKPTALLSSTLRWTATVKTNCGSFTITLAVADSPRTTGSFTTLARSGFYSGVGFHRIARDFVIQGGDPSGTGLGGPGYTIVEAPPRGTRYLHGTVAMAKTATDAAGTSGSQFFIVTGEDAKLPPQYALLGQVTSGLDVVDAINDQRLQTTDPQGSAPVHPVVIQSVKIAHR